jgi:hypothetical protein
VRLPAKQAGSSPLPALHDLTKLAPVLEQVGPGALAAVVMTGPPGRVALALLGFVGLNFILRVVNPALDALDMGMKKRIRLALRAPAKSQFAPNA